MSLTARSVEALRRSETPYRVPDSRCTGLAVRVAPSGSKTWDLAYRIRGTGKGRRVSLGNVSDVSLEQARDRANALTSAARAGRDLVAEESEAKSVAASRITVEGLIESYIRRRVTGRLRTAKETESRLRRALASILERPAAGVRRRDIRALLDEVADEGLQREAEKRRQTIGAMFRWALSQDLVELDPTAGLTAYDPGTPRDRVLSDEEVRTLLSKLDSVGFPPGHADVFRLQLLTGARSSEIGGMRAEEVDPVNWTWTLPAARSKNKKLRITPLVGWARRIVERLLLECPSGPFFTTETGMPINSANMGKSLQARREKLGIDHFTTHDLRRTAATRMVELVGSFDIVALAIGQEAGGRDTRTLTRHYVRTDMLDRKTAVFDAWDRRVQELVSGAQPADNVTVLRPAAKSAA